MLLSLATENIDVIATQESHLKRYDEEPHLPGYTAFRADCLQEPKRGMLVYMRSRYKSYSFIYRGVRASELWIIVKGYPFTADRPGMIVDLHWHPMTLKQIDYAVQSLQKHADKYSLLVMGDFNIKPPVNVNWQHTWSGDNHSKLGKVLQAVKGFIGSYSTSPVTHLDSRSVSTLDYIISPAGWSAKLIDTAVLMRLVGSDHRPLLGVWAIEASDNWMFNTTRLSHSEIERAAAHATQLLESYEGNDLQEVIDDIQQFIQVIIDSRPKHNLRKYWASNPEIQYWRRRSSRAYKSYFLSGFRDAEMYEAWKFATSRLRTICRLARYKSWNDFLIKLTDRSRTTSRQYYQICQKLAGRPSQFRNTIRISDENNEPVGAQQTAELFGEYFRKLYGDKEQHDQIFLDGQYRMQEEILQHKEKGSPLRCLAKWGELLAPIVEAETSIAIKDANSWTSSGSDQIPMDVWKNVAQSKQGVTQLTRLLNALMETGNIPISWLDCICVPIPKIDHPYKVEHYRGIMITQTLYRVFMKIQQRRLTNSLEEKGWLKEEQAGFRRHRGTVDHILTVMEIAERRRSEDSQNTFVAFMDVKQAYDTVHPLALQSALMDMGMPYRYVELIRSLYGESSMQLNLMGSPSVKFVARTGIRQGCPLAPVIFTIFIDSLIGDLRRGPRLLIPGVTPEAGRLFNGGVPVNSLWYADDGILLGNSPRCVQELLDIMEGWMKIWGLRVNVQKCAAMVICSKPVCDMQLTINQQPIPNVKVFNYLGATITNKVARKALGAAYLNALKKDYFVFQKFLYRTWHAPFQIRQRLIRAIIEGKILYCAEIWMMGTLEDKSRKAIGGFAELIWGSPSHSNREINVLEMGWTDIVWTTLQKRIRLENNLDQRLSGPLKLLWETRDEFPCLMANMHSTIRDLDISEEDKERTIKYQVNKEMTTRLTNRLLKPSGRLEQYMTYFWRKDVIKNDQHLVLAWRFYHALRMNCFYDWKRICWWLHRPDAALTCGFCGEETEETREHLMVRCTAWERARQGTIGPIIGSLRKEGASDEVISILLLGGEVEDRCLKDWVARAVLPFLEDVRRMREEKRKRLEAN